VRLSSLRTTTQNLLNPLGGNGIPAVHSAEECACNSGIRICVPAAHDGTAATIAVVIGYCCRSAARREIIRILCFSLPRNNRLRLPSGGAIKFRAGFSPVTFHSSPLAGNENHAARPARNMQLRGRFVSPKQEYI
jgi:hypothetical protein